MKMQLAHLMFTILNQFLETPISICKWIGAIGKNYLMVTVWGKSLTNTLTPHSLPENFVHPFLTLIICSY